MDELERTLRAVEGADWAMQHTGRVVIVRVTGPFVHKTAADAWSRAVEIVGLLTSSEYVLVNRADLGATTEPLAGGAAEWGPKIDVCLWRGSELEDGHTEIS